MNTRVTSHPATPNVREALLDVTEARKALERGEQAWNASQLRDALRSAEDFIAAAQRHLDKNDTTLQQS